MAPQTDRLLVVHHLPAAVGLLASGAIGFGLIAADGDALLELAALASIGGRTVADCGDASGTPGLIPNNRVSDRS